MNSLFKGCNSLISIDGRGGVGGVWGEGRVGCSPFLQSKINTVIITAITIAPATTIPAIAPPDNLLEESLELLSMERLSSLFNLHQDYLAHY